MGYANYADYSLENTMAKNSANVDNFLEQLIKEYAPKADAETKAIEEYARKTEGSDFQLPALRPLLLFGEDEEGNAQHF